MSTTFWEKIGKSREFDLHLTAFSIFWNGMNDKGDLIYDSKWNAFFFQGRLPEKDLLFFLTHIEIGKLIETRSPRLISRFDWKTTVLFLYLFCSWSWVRVWQQCSSNRLWNDSKWYFKKNWKV